MSSVFEEVPSTECIQMQKSMMKFHRRNFNKILGRVPQVIGAKSLTRDEEVTKDQIWNPGNIEVAVCKMFGLKLMRCT